MRRRPRLPDRNGRRRTPRAMPGTAHMRSIVRVWARVHPVLIGRRDEEHRPPVRLRPLSSPGGSVPPLRPREHLLLAGLRRDGAAGFAAPCRPALPEQPARPSQACRAPAALPRTAPRPHAGDWPLRAESDASPFDPRSAASCCGGPAGGALRNAALRPRAARQGVPLRPLRPVLRAGDLSGTAPGTTRRVRWRSTRRPARRSCVCITPRSGRSARSPSSSASIARPSTGCSPMTGCRGGRGGEGARRSIPSCPSSAGP